MENCDKKYTAKGLCQMHYRRKKLYGNAELRPGRIRKNQESINNNGYAYMYEPENANAKRTI